MVATSVIPGIARTSARFSTDRTLPLIVGGLHTIVGRAPGMFRSIAKVLRPVTASSASIRFWGLPMTVNSDRGLSVTETCSVCVLAAR